MITHNHNTAHVNCHKCTYIFLKQTNKFYWESQNELGFLSLVEHSVKYDHKTLQHEEQQHLNHLGNSPQVFPRVNSVIVEIKLMLSNLAIFCLVLESFFMYKNDLMKTKKIMWKPNMILNSKPKTNLTRKRLYPKGFNSNVS